MKAIRITFETVEDDGTVGLTRAYLVSAIELRDARMPMLPVAAESEARKFWDAVVGMGKLDDA